MTTEELRDWHARRAGWKITMFTSGKMYWVLGDTATNDEWPHPFPATIDGAASAMPPGWEWSRLFGFKSWYAACPDKEGRVPKGWEVDATDTGDEVHGRYLLAKLAWEAMGPTK